MSWIGWDYWVAPEGYVDVVDVWPAWEQEGSMVVFWIGRTMESDIQQLFSQHATVGVDGTVTPDGDVAVIRELDERENWHIYSVQQLSNGGYAVWAHHEEVTSA